MLTTLSPFLIFKFIFKIFRVIFIFNVILFSYISLNVPLFQIDDLIQISLSIFIVVTVSSLHLACFFLFILHIIFIVTRILMFIISRVVLQFIELAVSCHRHLPNALRLRVVVFFVLRQESFIVVCVVFVITFYVLLLLTIHVLDAISLIEFFIIMSRNDLGD